MVLDNLRMLIIVTRRISVLLELRNKDGEFWVLYVESEMLASHLDGADQQEVSTYPSVII